jgi:hypothetical protein
MFNHIHTFVRRATLALALAVTSGLAAAGTIHVNVDTTVFGLDNGFLDLQLSAGDGPLVTATVSHLTGFDSASLVDGLHYTLNNGAFTLRSDEVNDLFFGVPFSGVLGFDLTLSSDADPAGHVSSFLVSAFAADGVTPVGEYDPFTGSLAGITWTPAAVEGGQGSIGTGISDPGAVATVPEPGAWLLMGAGALGMALARRRRAIGQAA